jgi:CIC family chloride channel protein
VSGVSLASPARRLLVPAAGGLLAGFVLPFGARLARSARGWDILEAVALRSGLLPLRSSLVRAASSLVTQASAGAVGREGPIVLVASATASRLGRLLGLPPRQLRTLVGCGAAAGLACAYNTPLGAALFAAEILLGTLELSVLAPIAIASATATLLTWAAFGRDPVFHVPALAVASPWEILLHAALGLAAGLVAAAFLGALRTSAALFERLHLPQPLGMAFAGLALGVVLLGWPEVVGNGREAIAALFERPWGTAHVLVLLALRLLVTPLAVGSGTVGGVFTPTLFAGAMLGHAFGSVASLLLPGVAADPAAYALVGMGCVLAGTTHAPLTAVVMVFEMTLDYALVAPLLLAAAVATLVATRLSPSSVYTEALRRKEAAALAAPRAGELHVGDLARAEQVTVAAELPLPDVLDALVAARRNHLYVIDAQGGFAGAVNLHDVNDALRSAGDPGRLRARDLVRERFETTTAAEPLARVLERFAAQESERLPVLADDGSGRLVGTISRRDVLAVYARELLERRRDAGA